MFLKTPSSYDYLASSSFIRSHVETVATVEAVAKDKLRTFVRTGGLFGEFEVAVWDV